jgi:hypothetical protein
MARRARTIILMAEGSRPPFNISGLQALMYPLSADGTLGEEQAEALRESLTIAVRASQDRLVSDSPI